MAERRRRRVVRRRQVTVRTKVREERKRRRKLFAKILGSVLTLAGLVIGGRFLLFSSSIFALSDVVVEEQGSKGQGAEGSRVQGFEGKIKKSLGKNWLFIKAREAVKALSEDPTVKVVSVERSFPGKVVVKVEDRKPYAILDLGPLFLVDDEGLVFAQVKPQVAETLRVPRITGSGPAIVGEKERDADLAAALSLIKAAREKGWELRSVSLKREAFRTQSTEGQVVFGQGDLETQLERLNVTKDEITKMGLGTLAYDLRFKDQVVVTVNDTASPGVENHFQEVPFHQSYR
jgi:cell division protein FtsQ